MDAVAAAFSILLHVDFFIVGHYAYRVYMALVVSALMCMSFMHGRVQCHVALATRNVGLLAINVAQQTEEINGDEKSSV